MGLNDDLRDDVIGHAVDLNRFGESVREKIVALIYDLGEDIEKKIREADIAGATRTDFKIRRQNTLLKQVKDTIATRYKKNRQILDDELLELADIEKEYPIKLLNLSIGGELASTALTRTDLKVLVLNALIEGAPSRDWWSKQASDLNMRFASQVRLGVAAGETNDDIVRRIRGRYTGQRRVIVVDGKRKVLKQFEGGIMNTSTREATALVRSSVQTIANLVHEQVYQENQDVLKGRQWVSTLDTRTTEICRARDGGAWDFNGKPLPQSTVKTDFPGPPPAHWQCRSVLVPITKSWDELIAEAGRETKKKIPEVPESTRASMDGQVAAGETYESWFKKQTEARQIEILGPTKHALWKEGSLTFSDMVDPTGRALKISELRQLVERGGSD